MLHIDENKISYEIEVFEDDTPVRGNAMASGDDAYDKKVEDEILDRLARGDVWAWANVVVIAKHDDVDCVDGRDYLGCCNYASEADFCQPGDYYDDMKKVARDDLIAQLEDVAEVFGCPEIEEVGAFASGDAYPLPCTE